MQANHRGGPGKERKLKARSDKPAAKYFLIPVYAIVFCAFFDTHAQMPVLAPYTLSFGATPFLLGLVVGSYSLLNIFGNFTGGAIIDQKGWRDPLIYGLLGVSLALLLYTQAGSAYHLVMIRAGHGFMGGLLIPAALASLTAGKNEGSSYYMRLALFGATIGLAAITGPLFAGITANRLGFQAVYYGLAILMAAALAAALLLLEKDHPTGSPLTAPAIPVRWILSRPKLQGAFIFALGTMGSTGTLASFLPARAGLLGLDHARTGMLFATFALTAIVIQVLWPGRLKPLVKGDFSGCAVGLALLCAALVLAASAPAAPLLYAAMVIYGTGFGFSFQGMLGLVMENSDPAWRGRAIGIFFAAYSLGVALMPPLSGLIWQYLPAVFPFYTAAAAAMLSLAAGKNSCSG